ncbi:hypothetical protein GGR40_001009 [Novosphingobium gossypii]
MAHPHLKPVCPGEGCERYDASLYDWQPQPDRHAKSTGHEMAQGFWRTFLTVENPYIEGNVKHQDRRKSGTGTNVAEPVTAGKGMTMLRKIGRLFVIKSNWEAYMVIYALALGAIERGSVYLTRFPGFGGKLLFLACTGAVFMGGAKILDCIKYEKAALLAKVEQAPDQDMEPERKAA